MPIITLNISIFYHLYMKKANSQCLSIKKKLNYQQVLVLFQLYDNIKNNEKLKTKKQLIIIKLYFLALKVIFFLGLAQRQQLLH